MHAEHDTACATCVSEHCVDVRDAVRLGVLCVWLSLQLLNVLVVAPESLVGLVNGSLRMAHRYVLGYWYVQSPPLLRLADDMRIHVPVHLCLPACKQATG